MMIIDPFLFLKLKLCAMHIEVLYISIQITYSTKYQKRWIHYFGNLVSCMAEQNSQKVFHSIKRPHYRDNFKDLKIQKFSSHAKERLSRQPLLNLLLLLLLDFGLQFPNVHSLIAFWKIWNLSDRTWRQWFVFDCCEYLLLPFLLRFRLSFLRHEIVN
jgi:hypothetical protein